MPEKTTIISESEENKFNINEKILLSVDSEASYPWMIFFVNKNVWPHYLLELQQLGCNEVQLGKIMGGKFQ